MKLKEQKMNNKEFKWSRKHNIRSRNTFNKITSRNNRLFMGNEVSNMH